jgi:hypothetical protein
MFISLTKTATAAALTVGLALAGAVVTPADAAMRHGSGGFHGAGVHGGKHHVSADLVFFSDAFATEDAAAIALTDFDVLPSDDAARARAFAGRVHTRVRRRRVTSLVVIDGP